MANLSVTINTKEFDEFAKEAPAKVARALSNVIQKVTLLVERGGKIRSPVDTGRLRSSITSSIRPLQAQVSTNVNYASFVHDGTRFMTARPFLAEALADVAGQVESITMQELRTLD